MNRPIGLSDLVMGRILRRASVAHSQGGHNGVNPAKQAHRRPLGNASSPFVRRQQGANYVWIPLLPEQIQDPSARDCTGVRREQSRYSASEVLLACRGKKGLELFFCYGGRMAFIPHDAARVNEQHGGDAVNARCGTGLGFGIYG